MLAHSAAAGITAGSTVARLKFALALPAFVATTAVPCCRLSADLYPSGQVPGREEARRSRVGVRRTGAGSEVEEEVEKPIDIIGGNGNSIDSSRVMGREMIG